MGRNMFLLDPPVHGWK